ncbi:hypothetical protein RRF57_003118 [Xylaria bambusicola]|uniref:Uncharacterized protein n=1 Tax=Xylaria bambusicola TaxID=326684 RepID=A0AAN7UEL3_9PEZI
MATNLSSRAAKGDLENHVQSRRFETRPSTRLVREITFKILPLCSFLLVVFSAGAILISTFSFNEPLPHQAALVISIILLLFFVLFSLGLLCLHYRKSLSHASEFLNPIDSPRHNAENDEGRPKGHSGKGKKHVRPGLGGNIIRTDTLRGQAPSPSAYRKSIQEQEDITRTQEMLHEPRDSTAQHDQHHSNGSAQILPSSPARPGYSETARPPNSITYNKRTHAGPASVPQYDRAYAFPATQNPQKSPIMSLSGRGLARPPPPVVINMRHSTDPRNRLDIPRTRQRVKGPREMPRHNSSSRALNPNKEAPNSSLPTLSNLGGNRSQQPQTVPLAPRAVNEFSKSPTQGRERQRPDLKMKGNKAHAVHRRFSFELSSAKGSVNQDVILPATSRKIPGFKFRHPSAVPEPLNLVFKKSRVDTTQGEDISSATHDLMEMRPQRLPIARKSTREEDGREDTLQYGGGRRRPLIPRRSSSRKQHKTH